MQNPEENVTKLDTVMHDPAGVGLNLDDTG
jgi:hypothetical protein